MEPRAFEAILVAGIARAARAGPALGSPEHGVTPVCVGRRDGVHRERAAFLLAPPFRLEERADARRAADLDHGDRARGELGFHVAAFGEPLLRQGRAQPVAGEERQLREPRGERLVVRQGEVLLGVKRNGSQRALDRSSRTPLRFARHCGPRSTSAHSGEPEPAAARRVIARARAPHRERPAQEVARTVPIGILWVMLTESGFFERSASHGDASALVGAAGPRAREAGSRRKYELLRKLGTGAMGEVWAAKHLSLDEEVAIKVVLRDVEHEDGSTADSRFLLEARVARMLSRKTRHIVSVSDHGDDGPDRLPRDGALEAASRSTSRLARSGALPNEKVGPARAAGRARALGRARRRHRPSRSQARQRVLDPRRRGQSR